jgi:hypothetical protein
VTAAARSWRRWPTAWGSWCIVALSLKDRDWLLHVAGFDNWNDHSSHDWNLNNNFLIPYDKDRLWHFDDLGVVLIDLSLDGYDLLAVSWDVFFHIDWAFNGNIYWHMNGVSNTLVAWHSLAHFNFIGNTYVNWSWNMLNEAFLGLSPNNRWSSSTVLALALKALMA